MKIFSFTYCIGVSGLCESLGDHISGGIEFDYRIVKGHDIRILIILYSCFEKDHVSIIIKIDPIIATTSMLSQTVVIWPKISTHIVGLICSLSEVLL